MTNREVPELWAVLESIRRRATGAQLLLARRLDDTSAPRDAGLRIGAESIAKVGGSSPRAGYDAVAASKRLADQPIVARAVLGGELSGRQAQVIADAAAADPAAESRLVELGRTVSLKELREECARVKAAADPDPDATYRRLHRERRLRTYRNDEGFFCLSGRGTPGDGAEVTVVLDALIDEIFQEARKRDVHEPRDTYRWDALVEMSRLAWAQLHNQTAAAAYAAASDEDVKRPRTRRRGPGVNSRYRAAIRIDYEALVRGWVDGDEICEIDGIGPVSVPAARKLLGEAILDLLITRGKEVATVTTAGRGPNALQKLALNFRYPQCARTGCARPVAEWDHRNPYADKPETNIHNLDGLCRICHALKTYEGWALLPGKGKRPMVPPQDPRHPGNPTYHRRRSKRGTQAAA